METLFNLVFLLASCFYGPYDFRLAEAAWNRDDNTGIVYNGLGVLIWAVIGVNCAYRLFAS